MTRQHTCFSGERLQKPSDMSTLGALRVSREGYLGDEELPGRIGSEGGKKRNEVGILARTKKQSSECGKIYHIDKICVDVVRMRGFGLLDGHFGKKNQPVSTTRQRYSSSRPI